LMVGSVRTYDLKRRTFVGFGSKHVEQRENDNSDQYVNELDAIGTEFSSLAHRSLDVSRISMCAMSHIGRALRPDFLAISIADIEHRRLKVEQSVGAHMLGFTKGDIRSVSESRFDQLATGNLRIVGHQDLLRVVGESHFAASALEAGMRSALVANFENADGELIAQVWVASTSPDRYTDADARFMLQISDHLKSAITNGRNSESLVQLQQHLVAQNELFAQMQDGVENTEGALRLSHLQLTELSESKTQFMSEVAHEIKSPLAVMIGYADLLRFDVDNIGSEQREFAASIEKTARQLAVLVDDMSDITNIESGHFTTAKELHDVSKVVYSVVEGLKVSSKDIEGRLQIPTSIDECEVEGDPARLSQVLTNLITNALKYSAEDQAVEISVDSNDARVRISVADHGLGISPEDMEKLFTPYFRTMNPEAKKRPGTGLGLFLSKSIVEEHGGTLTVSSKVGLGSTFTVELPASADSSILTAA